MNDMEITRIEDRDFFLFLDIFVHWSGDKITATGPYYGDDIDWAEHGVDLEKVELAFGPQRVVGRYIPHRLDSWEPCVLFDFEDPDLADYLRDHETIDFTVTAGSCSKQFSLGTKPARGHEIAMSVIVRDCNQWVPYFLDYYLNCLECDHVYLYDNYTEDADGLQRIVQPFADRGQVTYIPWHYRWKNITDRKQIGQIPQQAHSLNKFGRCQWIGFFDYDEFLRIPGLTLKQFLTGYDPVETDGLSFGLRWFMYKGSETLGDVGNPLLSFFDAKRDTLERKRQKLIVSPRNVRFIRIHWLEEGKQDIPIDDTDIYFHHYYLNPDRFEEGKTEPGTTRDDYMLGFAESLILAARARGGDGEAANKTPVKDGLRPKPRTAEEWIAHVMDAFSAAEADATKLSDAVLDLPGMCGTRNRHFLNALCAFETCHYLEIGSYKGASLCAAMSGNKISAVAIDNWSEFEGPRDEFMAATAKNRGACELQVIEQDCFAVDPAELGTFDVYYYDGNHSTDSHTRAIKRFYDCLADRAVIIVDDWNWNGVREGTRRAMAKLDIPIIFEKEIILPEADVVDMPRHRGRKTWWNGICVMIIDKQAAPLSKSTRPRAITGAPDRALDPRSPIEVIVFSKDRACQLEALLRSMERFLAYPHRTTVLYTASDGDFEHGYDVLKDWYDTVTWLREADFKSDLIGLIDEAGERGTRNVMFLVDDIVFTRHFNGEQMIDLLEGDDDILALSLRLGDNIRHCHPRGAATAPPEFLDDRRWAWRDAHPGYWDYPMSVDGNVYRVSDIAETLAGIDFHNPNTLEATMAGSPIDRRFLVCHTSPYLVNLALNLVQNVFDNPHGDIPAENLNQCFLSGFMIDIEPFEGREFSACHFEPKIALIPHSRPVSTAPSRDEASPEDKVSVSALEQRQALLGLDVVPVRRRFVKARPKGDGLTLQRRLARNGVRLNETGSAVWSLCDGRNPVGSICSKLEQIFQNDEDAIRGDVMMTLVMLESHGMLAFRDAPDNPVETICIDLRQIPFYVINCTSDTAKRDRMRQQLSDLGLQFEFVEAMECEPGLVGTAISHLRILNQKDIKTPFCVLEDDCQFNEKFRYEFTVPANTDAFYLGVSRYGIKVPGELSWDKYDQVQWSRYDENNLRVFNMLGRHAILYLSDAYRQASLAAKLNALVNFDYIFPGDVGAASTHLSHLVLTPLEPVCYQAGELGGNQKATEKALTEPA
jgi:hypothetical protein